MKIKLIIIVLIILCVADVFASSIAYRVINNNHTEYTVFIDTKIELPFRYRSVYMVLKNARETDTINIVINTPGGYLHTCIALYAAIKTCKATTNAIIYRAYSGGSIIAMACDNIIVNDFSIMMIHMPGVSIRGNVFNIQRSASYSIKETKKMYKKIFKNFLTQKEFNLIFKGGDLFLGDTVMRIKLRNRNRLLH